MGITDFHSQCAHWLGNDRAFAGAWCASVGRRGRRPLREHDGECDA
nr:MAG TPA: hypothetical protein [Caudoviricetes sp.]